MCNLGKGMSLHVLCSNCFDFIVINVMLKRLKAALAPVRKKQLQRGSFRFQQVAAVASCAALPYRTRSCS